MLKLFSTGDLDGPVHCSQCSWEGNGRETKKEDLFLTDAVELYCPQCDTYLGLLNKDEST